MPTAYLVLKLVHVLLVVAALGANFTYGVWFARANAHPAFAQTALRGIKFIDDWIANPAYVLLLPTGAAMVYIAGLSFQTHWIEWAMGLWVIAILGGYLGYAPTLRAQIHAVDRAGIDSDAAKELAVRGQIWGAFLAIVVLAIIVLMIFKPA